MELITHENFIDGTWSFSLGERGHQLTNASQYVDNGIRYKWRTPWVGMEMERFTKIGDGNYLLKNESGHLEVAYVLLRKIEDNSCYMISSSSFRVSFIEE